MSSFASTSKARRYTGDKTIRKTDEHQSQTNNDLQREHFVADLTTLEMMARMDMNECAPQIGLYVQNKIVRTI